MIMTSEYFVANTIYFGDFVHTSAWSFVRICHTLLAGCLELLFGIVRPSSPPQVYDLTLCFTNIDLIERRYITSVTRWFSITREQLDMRVLARAEL